MPTENELIDGLGFVLENGRLQQRDQKFAESLLEFHEERGFLSLKQRLAASTLLERYELE